MTDDPTTTLAAHAVDITWSRWLSGVEEQGEETIRCLCTCGEEMDEDDHAAHQLAVLAEEGWAIVKLPEGKSAEEARRDIWGYFGEPGTYCGLGVCALGNGHHGACKC